MQDWYGWGCVYWTSAELATLLGPQLRRQEVARQPERAGIGWAASWHPFQVLWQVLYLDHMSHKGWALPWRPWGTQWSPQRRTWKVFMSRGPVNRNDFWGGFVAQHLYMQMPGNAPVNTMLRNFREPLPLSDDHWEDMRLRIFFATFTVCLWDVYFCLKPAMSSSRPHPHAEQTLPLEFLVPLRFTSTQVLKSWTAIDLVFPRQPT